MGKGLAVRDGCPAGEGNQRHPELRFGFGFGWSFPFPRYLHWLLYFGICGVGFRCPMSYVRCPMSVAPRVGEDTERWRLFIGACVVGACCCYWWVYRSATCLKCPQKTRNKTEAGDIKQARLLLAQPFYCSCLSPFFRVCLIDLATIRVGKSSQSKSSHNSWKICFFSVS